MPTSSEALTHKLLSRLTRKIEEEAERRGLHPMDFVEHVADSIVSAACARVEIDPPAAGC